MATASPRAHANSRLGAPFDLLLERCLIVDGSGAPAFPGSVGIVGDRIAAVGRLEDAMAHVRIDAEGLVASPGFIDSHVHTDTQLLAEPLHAGSIHQGVTTHIVGQDGFGVAPTTDRSFAFMRHYTSGINPVDVSLAPGSVAAFLDRFDGATVVNVATLIPNGCLRLDVVGGDRRTATPSELEEMVALCQQGLDEGAVGLSSGLDYVPSMYASTDELVALCRAVAGAGGVYVSHIRYSVGLREAVAEAVEIGRRASVPVHLSHLRGDHAAGLPSGELAAMIDAARGDGIDLTFDLYPYTYGSTFLAAMLPPWLFLGAPDEIRNRLRDPDTRSRIRDDISAQAGWSWWEWLNAGVIIGEPSPANARYVGLDMARAAALSGQDAVDFACDLLLAEELGVLLVWRASETPDDVTDLDVMLRHPSHMIGSDGIYSRGRVHPRAYGAIARFVGRFVREGNLALEEAVRRATSAPASRFSLSGRGLLRPGYYADLVVFDPAVFVDVATWDNGRATATGVRHVVVNGALVLEEGVVTGATPGRGLRRRRDTTCDHRAN